VTRFSSLAKLLVDSGAVTQPQMAAIYEHAARAPGQADVDAELLTLASEHEDVIAAVVAERTQVPAVVFGSSTIDLTALDLVTADFLREHQVLPVLARSDDITVAVADPARAAAAVAHLGVMLARRIVVVTTVAQLLAVAIERALDARRAGGDVLRGGRAVDGGASLTLRSPHVKARIPRPDSIARALADVFDDLTESVPGPPRAPTLGALRLKKVRSPVSGESDAGVIERSLVKHERPHVLIVEDDEAIGLLLSRSLQGDGYDTHHVLTGDAVGQALSNRRPDVIVLDAVVPGVHGFEICAALKASPEWRSTPVIMISAVFRGFERAHEIQEQHGADAFIEKPFQLDHVRRVVADLLRQPLPAAVVTPAQHLSESRARALVDHHVTVGDIASANAVVTRWLASEPLSARAWLERGHLAMQGTDYMGALQSYEIAAVYDRTMFNAQVSLASLYEQLGFKRRAKTTWMAAAACAPDHETGARIRAGLKS
jgi:DNA-binding response OmpR family regulator